MCRIGETGLPKFEVDYVKGRKTSRMILLQNEFQVLVTSAAVVSSGPTDSLDDFFSELDGIRSGDTTAPPKSNDAQRSSTFADEISWH